MGRAEDSRRHAALPEQWATLAAVMNAETLTHAGGIVLRGARGAREVLLVRPLARPEAPWVLPKGHIEPGEDAEAAALREVREESGIVVERVEFVASQPWPFPASLMIGFRAYARGGDPVPDGVEMAEVRWFTRAELAGLVATGEVLLPPGLSISRRLIEEWFGGPLGAAAV